jgi:hypothetical protein
MVGTRHLIISLSISILILALGTIGYMTIEGWPFIDALYMTVITISTVGFKEVNQIDGAGRIFTILLVFFGVGFTLYVAAAIVQKKSLYRLRIWTHRQGALPASQKSEYRYRRYRKGFRTNPGDGCRWCTLYCR